MKKKIFWATGAFVAVCSGSVLFLHLKQEAKPLSALALANIEALSSPEVEVGKPCLHYPNSTCSWPDEPITVDDTFDYNH